MAKEVRVVTHDPNEVIVFTSERCEAVRAYLHANAEQAVSDEVSRFQLAPEDIERLLPQNTLSLTLL